MRGNAIGEHAYTLTVTDIATGWTENRSVPNKARKWVIATLDNEDPQAGMLTRRATCTPS